MSSASCLSACKEGKEPWCSETNKLITQIKMYATGIKAVTEQCLRASGESVMTHLSCFAGFLWKKVKIGFSALKDVSQPLGP